MDEDQPQQLPAYSSHNEQKNDDFKQIIEDSENPVPSEDKSSLIKTINAVNYDLSTGLTSSSAERLFKYYEKVWIYSIYHKQNE